jgi:hypothetical protein
VRRAGFVKSRQIRGRLLLMTIGCLAAMFSMCGVATGGASPVGPSGSGAGVVAGAPTGMDIPFTWGEDPDYGCTTAAPYWTCSDVYYHHLVQTQARYDGTGNLPLESLDICTQSSCVGNILFDAYTGDSHGNGYNSVYACNIWYPGQYKCEGVNSSELGFGSLVNGHHNTHYVHGFAWFVAS